MSDLTAEQKDKLMADLKLVLADAEALLSATAGDASAGVAELRSRVQATLAQAKTGLVEVQAAVIDKAKATAKATDVYVHENPWKSIGIAAGVGLMLGMLISRR
ncbi:MAG TPA: DUF883 family protein [Aquabacterium sp.]|jgi:ElaB/YqjD/DUF883 family membrane-anchored ribosome-binding protein|uniref:DUF883 family protein n=1 Tax=Aquabacterium sp. TaxID=1872578 RepID=UPI002E32D7A7|nr:DUF883 family protein [Aquabacterium sp.]HEX5372932.1 DUF883 family protein [Aquabacterium sp.]